MYNKSKYIYIYILQLNGKCCGRAISRRVGQVALHIRSIVGSGVDCVTNCQAMQQDKKREKGEGERIAEREREVRQSFCVVCQKQKSSAHTCVFHRPRQQYVLIICVHAIAYAGWLCHVSPTQRVKASHHTSRNIVENMINKYVTNKDCVRHTGHEFTERHALHTAVTTAWSSYSAANTNTSAHAHAYLVQSFQIFHFTHFAKFIDSSLIVISFLVKFKWENFVQHTQALSERASLMEQICTERKQCTAGIPGPQRDF